MKNIKPYPAYKPSGIAWLGEIPEHWEVRKLKYCCSKITDGSHFSPDTKPEGIPYITVTNVGDNKIDLENSKRISKDDYLVLKRNGCQPAVNDILLTKDGTIGRAAVVRENSEFVILSSLGLLSPKNSINSFYLRYYLVSCFSVNEMKSKIQGSALTRLTISIINNLNTVIPSSIEEQTAIAHFLDYKLHKIDRFIRKKKKLIALLNEQKAAIINDAVTKGLDPSVKMKKSGEFWLEHIPNHWQMIRAKHLFKLITDVAPPNNDEVLLSIYTQYGVKPRTEFEERGNRATTTDNYWIVKKQDIIVNKLLAWMGAIGISEYDGVTSPAYDILRSKGEANPYFYHYLFRIPIMFNEFKRHSRGIMDVRLRLYFSEFGDIKLPVPPLPEQRAIVAHIEQETATLNRTIATIEKEIALVQEYRTTLIAEAVTGKIDVRDYIIANGELIMENEAEEAEMDLDTEGVEEE